MKTVIFGQAPSRTSDPARPLSGHSGARLARLAGVERLDDAFELRNLFGFFPGRVARGDAFPLADARVVVETTTESLRGRRVILLGGSVASAFRYRGAPLVWTKAVGEETALDDDPFFEAALLPHPSGLNHWWNDPEHEAAASRFLKKEVRRWTRLDCSA